MENLTRMLDLHRKLADFSFLTTKPTVAFVGSFNSGKSTLVNRLLEAEISPVGILPTTPCLINFEYGNAFQATFTGAGGKKVFKQCFQLHAFLTQSNFPRGRLDIELPSPILKKCRIIDTPGIDSPGGDSGRTAEKAAFGADKLIYLFHQRGLEEPNRLFLQRLAFARRNKNLNDLSFWLNCNLGAYDGTSLETTRAALREIFLNPMRLNTINTLKPENVALFKVFLEMELLREALRQVSGKLKKADAELPQKIKKTCSLKDNAIFLSEFWHLKHTADLILQAGKLLHSFPAAGRELETHLKHMHSDNLKHRSSTPGGKLYRIKSTGPGETRDALLDLLHWLLNEPRLLEFTGRSKLKQLLQAVSSKRFTIVTAGGFSTGKSTFLNALMKEKLLPTADGPTTTCMAKLTYGRRKTAVVKFPMQVTLHLCEQTGGKVSLCREKLAVLEKWLSDPDSGIACLEACTDGPFKYTGRREISDLIRQVKEFFAAGTFGFKSGIIPPAAFKPMSVKRFKKHGIMEKIRISFRSYEQQQFDLAVPEEIRSFQNSLGSVNAFRIETVDLHHPSELLKLGDFIDTPGLDSINQHHRERTSRWIRHSDACLFFLNARHILNQLDCGVHKLFTPQKKTDVFNWKDILNTEQEKFILVINFSDLLTPSQREAIFNFVRRSLSSEPVSGCKTGTPATKPAILFISALKGVSGQNGGTDKLIRCLEENVLKTRGRKFHLDTAQKLYSVLDGATRNIYDQLMSGGISYAKKSELRGTQETLRQLKRMLKNIRAAIYEPGRL